MTTELIEAKKEKVERGRTDGAAVVEVRISSDVEGLFEAVAAAGEVSEAEFAVRAGMAVGAARGWLETQYRSGYMDRDAVSGRYRLWCPIPGA
jgi:hypothetical protein